MRGSIYQRKDQRWVAALRHNGVRRMAYRHNRGEATQALEEMLESVGLTHEHEWLLGARVKGVAAKCKHCGKPTILAL